MRLTVAAAILLSTFGAHVYADAVIKRFDIPAQRAPAALNEFARQADVTLVFSYERVEQARTNEVRGEYSVIDALDRLIDGTTLAYRELGGGAIAISAGTEISSAPIAQGTGEPPQQQRTSPAQSAKDSTQRSEVEEIVVTGTRFNDRTPLTSPVPIGVVPSTELRSAGHSELAESLSAAVPSLNFPPAQPASSASALRPFTLRGLPANEVLVLVNGKRWHSTAISGTGQVVFDFNSLPPTSIGSVEVLRDGASAQYGSDAIAGVVNLRLREDTDTELVATTGQYYEGDGLTVESGIDTGWSLGDGGFLHASTYFRDSDNTNRQGMDVRQQYFALNSSGAAVNTSVANVFTQTLPTGISFDPREFTNVDRRNNFNFGNDARRELGLNFNSQIPVSEWTTAYAFGGYMHRTAETLFTWRLPRDNATVRAIYPDGFAPLREARIADAQLAAGLKGRAGEWDWDLSESWGFNRQATYSRNNANPSFGAASPTSFFSGSIRAEQATTNLDVKRDIDIGLGAPLHVALGSEYRREGTELRAGEPGSYASGGSPVLDGPSAGTAAPIGASGVGGISPLDVVDASRNSIAGYVDLEHQVTDKLLVALAGRYEHYNDFGATVNGKLAFLQELNPIFAIRGSVSTGFRAPSLFESYYSLTSTSLQGGQFVNFRLFPVADPAAQALGAKALEPEESINYSLGSIITLGDGLSFTADVYRIDITDAIILSSLFSGTDVQNFLAAQGFPGISSFQFYTNAVDKRVTGLDVEGHYAMAFDDGSQLMLSSALNFNDVEVLSVDPAPAQLGAVTATPLFNQQAIGAVERGVPRSRINLSARYRQGSFEIYLRGTRYGSTAVAGAPNPQQNQVYGAKWVTDLDLTYELTEAVRLSIGAQNLFDEYPDENNAFNNPTGLTPYGLLPFAPVPFGFNGGYYYARALLRF